MDMITCPNCKMRVILKSNGTCPSCQTTLPQNPLKEARLISPKMQIVEKGTDPLRHQIYQSMDLKDTAELLEIWGANDRNEWSGDAFAAIKEVLQDRNVKIPRQGQVKGSEKLVAKGVRLTKRNNPLAQKHYDHAHQNWQGSKYSEALKESDKAIEFAPEWSEAHILRGVILEELDLPDQSFTEYIEAARLDPKNKDVRINMQSVMKAMSPTQRKAANALAARMNLPSAVKPVAAANPQSTYEVAYGIVYFIGALNFILGSAVLLFKVGFLQQAGFNAINLLYGLVFLALGFFVHKKRSMVALILAIGIYGLDSLLALLPILSQASFLLAGLIFARIIFISPMIQGVKAIRVLNRDAQPWSKDQ